jgi:hypothetical protein
MFSMDEEQTSTSSAKRGRAICEVFKTKQWNFKTHLPSIEFRYTLRALGLFACSLFLMCMANSMADRLNLNNTEFRGETRLILPDPIMSVMGGVVSDTGLSTQINDLSLAAVVVSAFLYVSFFFSTPSRWIPLRRLFMVWSTMNCLRAICITLTILTNPYLKCTSKPLPNLFADAFALFITRRQSCGDVFFSGHSVSFTLSCLMWLTYRRRDFASRTIRILHRTFTISFISFVVLCLLTLIVTRFHYSVDVFMGSLLSIIIWQMTHWSLDIDQLKSNPFGALINMIDGTYSPSEFVRILRHRPD